MANSKKIQELTDVVDQKVKDLNAQLQNNELILYFSKSLTRMTDSYAKIAVAYKKMCDREQIKLHGDQLWEDGLYYQGTPEQQGLGMKYLETLKELVQLSQQLKREVKKGYV